MSKKVLIIIIIIFLLVVGIMGAGFFVLWSKVSSTAPPLEKESEKIEDVKSDKTRIGAVYPLDTFIVNLADQGGARYLRVTMNLEIKDETLAEELEKRLPQIRDNILMIIPTRKFEDINSIGGKNALRDEIITSLNDILSEGSITNLYFTEFVIQ